MAVLSFELVWCQIFAIVNPYCRFRSSFLKAIWKVFHYTVCLVLCVGWQRKPRPTCHRHGCWNDKRRTSKKSWNDSKIGNKRVPVETWRGLLTTGDKWSDWPVWCRILFFIPWYVRCFYWLAWVVVLQIKYLTKLREDVALVSFVYRFLIHIQLGYNEYSDVCC